jgi:hypothetical protein
MHVDVPLGFAFGTREGEETPRIRSKTGFSGLRQSTVDGIPKFDTIIGFRSNIV